MKHRTRLVCELMFGVGFGVNSSVFSYVNEREISEMHCLIETRELTRRFGTRVAVEELSLSVSAAGVYGFLGPNGAGKTTAIRMLLGLIRPNAGAVRLFGVHATAGNRASLMRRVKLTCTFSPRS